MQAVLKDCSFSAKHNFNLLSMSRLLHKQGWKIVRGNDSLIRIENGKGEVINFNIVVPTEKGQYMPVNLYVLLKLRRRVLKE